MLRFTKCCTCENLRTICWDTAASSLERADAREKLVDHYKFVKTERAGAIARANEAVMSPASAISMAIDGTSQLPRGVPQFPTSIHGEEKSINRLHHHFALAVVHGLGTRCYITRDNVASDPVSTCCAL